MDEKSKFSVWLILLQTFDYPEAYIVNQFTPITPIILTFNRYLYLDNFDKVSIFI